MKQYSGAELRVGMSLEVEADICRHIPEILEESRKTGGTDADGSLHLNDIYERFIYRRTEQALAAMVRDDQVSRLGCAATHTKDGFTMALIPNATHLSNKEKALSPGPSASSPAACRHGANTAVHLHG